MSSCALACRAGAGALGQHFCHHMCAVDSQHAAWCTMGEFGSWQTRSGLFFMITPPPRHNSRHEIHWPKDLHPEESVHFVRSQSLPPVAATLFTTQAVLFTCSFCTAGTHSTLPLHSTSTPSCAPSAALFHLLLCMLQLGSSTYRSSSRACHFEWRHRGRQQLAHARRCGGQHGPRQAACVLHPPR
jgi:hypothetical protein